MKYFRANLAGNEDICAGKWMRAFLGTIGKVSAKCLPASFSSGRGRKAREALALFSDYLFSSGMVNNKTDLIINP